MGHINNIKDLVEHFYTGGTWPRIAMKNSAIIHGRGLYAVSDGIYIPAAIKIGRGLFVVNNTNLKTRGALERLTGMIKALAAEAPSAPDVFYTTMEPVERPGIYPDITTTLNTMENFIQRRLAGLEFDWAQVGTIQRESIEPRRTDHVEKIEAIAEYRNEQEKQAEYNRYKELMCIDIILEETIAAGGISPEKYERLKRTYNEMTARAHETEIFIKHITSII